MANEPKKPEELEPREEPDDDAEARAFIMARRAKFVAAALAGAGLLAACGGETGPQPCLSPVATGGANTGSGGTAIGGSTNSGGFNACLSSGGYNNGTGGWCLQPPTGGYQGYGGAGGFNACLSPPQSGGLPGTGGTAGTGGVPPDAGDDAAASTGGTLGTGGLPVPCLSIPASAKPGSKE